MTDERWLPVVGDDRYLVSDLGRVWSVRAGRVLAATPDKGGYRSVYLPGRHNVRVNVLVLETFVGPRPPKHHACHGMGGKLDNSLANLRWDTASANALDRHGQGTMYQTAITHCPAGHSYAEHGFVNSSGFRECRKCANARKAASKRRARRRRAAA